MCGRLPSVVSQGMVECAADRLWCSLGLTVPPSGKWCCPDCTKGEVMCVWLVVISVALLF